MATMNGVVFLGNRRLEQHEFPVPEPGHDCRGGRMISCSSPERAAYGWQRNGGHADFLLAEERTLVALPDELSYLDGAMVACGGPQATYTLWLVGL